MRKRKALKRLAAIVLLVLAGAILLPAVPASAGGGELYDMSYDYIITGYYVNVVAHADNTYDITETIDVHFNYYKHGIYREIPTRYNGKVTPVTHIETYGEKTQIKNLMTEKYIRLGDANTEIIGDKRYSISYNLNMGKDENEGLDAIYLNIIGTDWGTQIDEVVFNIDVSELDGVSIDPSVTMGYAGSTDTSNNIVIVAGHYIIGRTTRALEPYEGVTLFASMPEGTLDAAKDPFAFRKILTYGVPLFTLMMLFAWTAKYGKKRTPVPVVSFYPPDGMNPTELGYAIDERVDNEDIGALIIYWASRGYLSITEERFGKFTLTKSGEMSVGHAAYEVGAFRKLWKLGDGTQVKSSELTNKYYTQVEAIRNGAKVPYEMGPKRLYREDAAKASSYIMLIASLCFAVLAFIGFPMFVDTSSSVFGSCLMTAIFMIGGYIFFCLWFEGICKRIHKRKLWKTVLFFIIQLASYGSLMALGISMFTEALSLAEAAALMLVPTLVMLVRPSIKQLTDYGLDLMQKVLGFRQFIETAEKERLEALIDKDSNYVYRILPYAIVLGVSDIWSKKFNTLMTEPPNWYSTYGTGEFTSQSLMHSMTRTTSSISNVASSQPSSSGSSGGGGGGFSGGGGGGGGGGSW